MPTSTLRSLTALAALAWIVVGGYGMWEVLAEDSGDNWETPYAIFGIALLLGTLLSVAAVWLVGRHEDRSAMRTAGFVVLALAVVSTLAAWALPLWMTLSALGYALVAGAGAAPWRRAVGLLGLAPLLGMAALFIGIAAEVGSQDEYGDHPAAFGIGTIVTAAVTVAALVQLRRTPLVQPADEVAETSNVTVVNPADQNADARLTRSPAAKTPAEQTQHARHHQVRVDWSPRTVDSSRSSTMGVGVRRYQPRATTSLPSSDSAWVRAKAVPASGTRENRASGTKPVLSWRTRSGDRRLPASARPISSPRSSTGIPATGDASSRPSSGVTSDGAKSAGYFRACLASSRPPAVTRASPTLRRDWKPAPMATAAISRSQGEIASAPSATAARRTERRSWGTIEASERSDAPAARGAWQARLLEGLDPSRDQGMRGQLLEDGCPRVRNLPAHGVHRAVDVAERCHRPR